MRVATRGRIWKFGDDIDTDQIFPGKYLTLTDKSEMARHAMEGVPGRTSFAESVTPGDVIVAGRNFGCGSSREHAAVAIKGTGIAAVIAKSFARIFYRNCVNMALPILECDAVDELAEGDTVEVDLRKGTVRNLTSSREYCCSGLSGLEFEILGTGGLIEYLKKHFLKADA
ncbi:3-isopropylmalate dehydratase [candidate division TA06 bacterium DG_26]|uniref:3-isopropylmalate dehydratase small subunit n=1 Tax=candidate division TA06 bacterium DG_26 TaxID=1703771 RepID=A0A0S7WKW3_UNCT6|nr:MAG: 3-isopropylmalate dehydratase [candidate division TA06 bacterium DG_26]